MRNTMASFYGHSVLPQDKLSTLGFKYMGIGRRLKQRPFRLKVPGA